MHRPLRTHCLRVHLHPLMRTCHLTGGIPNQVIDDLAIGQLPHPHLHLLHLLFPLLSHLNYYSMLKVQIWCLMVVALTALEVTVIGGDLPGGQREINSLKLSINSNGRYVYPSQDKHTFAIFELPQLPIGRNFVEVISTYHVYPLLMIDTKSTGENAFHLVHPFTRTILERAGEPLVLKSVDRLQYLFEEPSFSIASFLFSGTGMFMMFGVGVYLCYNNLMPKLEEAQLAPESADSHRQ